MSELVMFDDNGDPPGHYDVMNFQVMMMMVTLTMMMINDDYLTGDGELEHGVCQHWLLAQWNPSSQQVVLNSLYYLKIA